MERTKKECQTILFNLSVKHGVSPRLISERLLDDLDKDDMLSGILEISSLEAAIEIWKANGMPDYVGREKKTTEPDKPSLPNSNGLTYCPPFVAYSAVYEVKDDKGSSERESGTTCAR